MSRTFFDGKGVLKISNDWRLTLEARAHIDPVERLGYPKSVWVDPRQVLLDGKVKKVDVKLGLQQVVWGQADGLRVLDVINPLDYREFILEDFLDSRRPLWLARAVVWRLAQLALREDRDSAKGARSAQDALGQIAARRPGMKLRLKLQRGQAELDVAVEVGERGGQRTVPGAS